MKLLNKRRAKWLIPLLLAATIGTAAAVQLFVHTFPPVPVTQQLVVSTCSAPVLRQGTTVFSGSSGGIIFDCTTTQVICIPLFPGGPPFCRTITLSHPALTSTGGSVTPKYDLTGTGYSSLALISDSVLGTACDSTSTGFLALPPSPNTATALTVPAGTFNYCAQFTNAPLTGLGTFTVTWNQP